MQGLEVAQACTVVRPLKWTGWRGLCRFPTRPNESPKEFFKKKGDCMGIIKYDETYIGNKYNFLTVIGYEYDKYGNRCFKCRCDCGKVVLETPKYLINGNVKSCGCMQKMLLREEFIVHGGCSYGKPERLYKVYIGMIERCYNPRNQSYVNYGSRGIRVCQEWRDNYSTFKKWAIANGYDARKTRKEQSIDRINNNGNYEPNNCRWATAKEQRANQRPRKEYKKNAMIIVNGTECSKREVCAEYGVSVEMFDYRTKHKGMIVIEALTTPKMNVGRPRSIKKKF